MDKTPTFEPSDQEATNMLAAISRCITEIDDLRDEMRRDEEAVEKSARRTDANLAQIAGILEALAARRRS